MKSTQAKVNALEAELLRLNEMVRARRRQLSKLDSCPHNDCECRAVWHQVVEQNLASQMGRIGKTVKSRTKPGAARAGKSKPLARKK